MKVLTIWNPWARLIAEGHKRVENRSQPTDYRGPLLVHVGLHWKQAEVQEQLANLREHGLLDDTNTPNLVELHAERGKIICRTSIVGCRKVEEGDADPWAVPGQYAWELGDIEMVEPVAVRGSQGLFNLPAGVEILVRSASASSSSSGSESTPKIDVGSVASESPKALRHRLVAEAVAAEEGHGFVGQVHDRETGEVCFVSAALPTRQEAEEAAHGYVDDRIDEAVRVKLQRLELLETGRKYIERARLRLAEIGRVRKELGDEAKRLRASIEERWHEMQHGQQQSFDYGEGEETGEGDEAVEEGEAEAEQENRETQADEAFERMLEVAAIKGDDELLQERAATIVQLSVNALQEELRDETNVELIRAVADAEGKKKKSLRRKSVVAFLQRKLEQLFAAEEGDAA